MPVRNLLYDLLQYTHQIEQLAARHRQENPGRKATSAEFLSGFRKDDRLIPVVTLVVYFSPKRWDGPRSLRDMMDTGNDPFLVPLIPDYQLFMLEPAVMKEDDFRKFKTDLGPVLNFIKESRNKKKLRELMDGDNRFKDLDRRAAQVLEALTAVKMKIEEKDEEVNMCKAIRDMVNDGKQEERISAVQNIMETLNLTLDQAMAALKITGEDREYCLHALQPSAN